MVDRGLTVAIGGHVARCENEECGHTVILVATGCTDLVTPYAVSQYLIDHIQPIDGAVPVEMKMYQGGHMMYLRAPSRNALTTDAQRMYDEAMRSRSD